MEFWSEKRRDCPRGLELVARRLAQSLPRVINSLSVAREAQATADMPCSPSRQAKCDASPRVSPPASPRGRGLGRWRRVWLRERASWRASRDGAGTARLPARRIARCCRLPRAYPGQQRGRERGWVEEDPRRPGRRRRRPRGKLVARWTRCYGEQDGSSTGRFRGWDRHRRWCCCGGWGDRN